MNNISRAVIGGFVVIASLTVVAALFVFEVPKENQRLADMAIGLVLGWGGMVIQFIFGSSNDSQKKTSIIDAMANATPPEEPQP